MDNDKEQPFLDEKSSLANLVNRKQGSNNRNKVILPERKQKLLDPIILQDKYILLKVLMKACKAGIIQLWLYQIFQNYDDLSSIDPFYLCLFSSQRCQPFPCLISLCNDQARKVGHPVYV